MIQKKPGIKIIEKINPYFCTKLGNQPSLIPIRYTLVLLEAALLRPPFHGNIRSTLNIKYDLNRV